MKKRWSVGDILSPTGFYFRIISMQLRFLREMAKPLF